MIHRFSWSIVPAMLLIGHAAHAQEASHQQADGGDNAPAVASATVPSAEEIVVTALKQNGVAQRTPASVTVVDSTRLAVASVSNLIDIAKVAPALNTSVSPDFNQFVTTIRGLGSQPGNPSFDASVATYLNGAFLARDRELSVSLFDVSTIEVISGTQAALLGKNSSLGAINVVTTKPGDSFAASGRFEHEFELRSDRLEGGVDLPISETLRVRVAGFYNNQGGPLREVITGEQQRDKIGGGRITIAWQPAERVDITAVGQIVDGQSNGPNAQQIVVVGSAPELLASSFGFPNTIRTEFGTSALYSPALGRTRHSEINAKLGMLTANIGVGGGTFTSQTAYSYSRADLIQNSTYLPGDSLLAFIPDRSNQFTQELRYASDTGGTFDYIAGAFYLNGRFRQAQTQSTNYPLGTTPIPFPVTGTARTNFRQKNEAISGFAQGNYHITEPLTFTLGLRYTHETKTADLSRDLIVPGTYSLFLSPPVAPFTLKATTDSLDGSIGINYKPTRDLLFYASFGQGTKPGGFATAVSDLTQSFYKPERARTAELGFKTQFLERTLTLNATFFHTRVRNFQVVNFDGQNFVVFNQNVKSDGLESQIAWRPVPSLNLYWNNIYANVRDARTGVRIPFAPRWSGIVGGTVNQDLTSTLTADLDINLDYRSQVISLTEVQGVPYLTPPMEALHRLNVSVGLGEANGTWRVRLIAQNLNNQQAYGFAIPVPFVSSPPGTQNSVGFPVTPRTIKLQLNFKL